MNRKIPSELLSCFLLFLNTFDKSFKTGNIFSRSDLIRHSPARDVSSSDSDRDNTSEEKGNDHVRLD